MSDTSQTEILHNGDCPICAFEIGHHRRQAAARGLPVRFDDLNGPELARWGLDPDTAARRLHARVDGRLLAGFDAQRALWSAMPGTRWLARLVDLPVLRPLARATYERIAAPLLYRAHRRRVARAQMLKK